MNAIVIRGLLMGAAYSKGSSFVFFSAMVVLQFIVVLFFFPEINRARLDDISAPPA